MGTGLPGFCGGELVDVALDAGHELGVGLRKVGSARGGGVVAVAGGRGAGMEVAVGGEALRQQFGADDLAVFQNQAACGLVRKDDAGNAGDDERIAEAEQDRGDEGEAD